MKVIGITGGVGSGKSAVTTILVEKYHAYHINTDIIAREQMQKDGVSFKKVVKAFGTDILAADGEIDRKKLGEIVFHDDEKLKKLNQLTHPNVKKAVKKIIRQKKKEKVPFVLMESAILYRAGFSNLCDELWYIYATEETRTKRLKDSRGYTDEKVRSMMSKQDTEEHFREVCTVVIDNNGSFEDVQKQVQLLVEN